MNQAKFTREFFISRNMLKIAKKYIEGFFFNGCRGEVREICVKVGLPDATKLYLDLRVGIDPELVEADRAPYLRKVVLRRKDLEEQLRK